MTTLFPQIGNYFPSWETLPQYPGNSLPVNNRVKTKLHNHYKLLNLMNKIQKNLKKANLTIIAIVIVLSAALILLLNLIL